MSNFTIIIMDEIGNVVWNNEMFQKIKTTADKKGQIITLTIGTYYLLSI